MSETHIERYLRHTEVSGWHHHHTEAGALIHLDTASGHFIDTDGSTVIYSSHRTDHDELDVPAGPCVDETCSFNQAKRAVYAALGLGEDTEEGEK